RQHLEREPRVVRVAQLVLRRLRGHLHPPLRDGCLARLEDSVTDRFETHEYDVLVVGAGGAGLRAAIEAATVSKRVGLVCKSLLGKAHTVMAEGGIAAAPSNVDPAGNRKDHLPG